MSAAGRPVWWVAFADDESGEVISQALVTTRGLHQYYVRGARTMAEAYAVARERTLSTDTVKPRIFKRPADPRAPWRPIGRAA